MNNEEFSSKYKQLKDDHDKKVMGLRDEYLKLNGGVEIGDILVSDEKKIRVCQIDFIMNHGRLVCISYGGLKLTAYGKEYKNKAWDCMPDSYIKRVIKNEKEEQLFD